MKRDFNQHITLVEMKAIASLGCNCPSFYSDYQLVPPFRE
jgi:hypothetical protein